MTVERDAYFIFTIFGIGRWLILMGKRLIADRIKYRLWTPDYEEREFHPMIRENSKEIFGKHSIYFDLKHKIKSKAGIVSIPDAYVIILAEPYRWLVVENELSHSHDVYAHIVPQLNKFVTGVKSLESQKEIVKALHEEIKSDPLLKLEVEKKIEPLQPHEFLTDLISDQPIVVVIAEKITDVMKEACIGLPNVQFREFETFVREDAGNIRAYLFEPLDLAEEPQKEIGEGVKEKIKAIKDENVKSLFKQALTQLKENKCTIKPIHGRWLSVRFRGKKRFMYLAARNKWFVCSIQKANKEWTKHLQVRTWKDWEAIFSKYIQPTISALS